MDRQHNNTRRTSHRRDGTSTSLPSSVDDGRNSNVGSGRRRRAVIACRVCRARKVKCSNEKPSCAGCVRLGCECVYPKPPRNGLLPYVLCFTTNYALAWILNGIPPVPTKAALKLSVFYTIYFRDYHQRKSMRERLVTHFLSFHSLLQP